VCAKARDYATGGLADWNCARKSNSIKYITNYFIDPPPNNNANPIGGDRICNLTVTNLEKGLYTRNVILQQLSKNNWWNNNS